MMTVRTAPNLLKRFPTSPFRFRDFIGKQGSKINALKEVVAKRWSESVAAPGFDLLYEALYRYGLYLALYGSLVYFAWVLWTMDGSGGQAVIQ